MTGGFGDGRLLVGILLHVWQMSPYGFLGNLIGFWNTIPLCSMDAPITISSLAWTIRRASEKCLLKYNSTDFVDAKIQSNRGQQALSSNPWQLFKSPLAVVRKFFPMKEFNKSWLNHNLIYPNNLTEHSRPFPIKIQRSFYFTPGSCSQVLPHEGI